MPLSKRDREFLSSNFKGLMQEMLEWMEQRNSELRKTQGLSLRRQKPNYSPACGESLAQFQI